MLYNQNLEQRLYSLQNKKEIFAGGTVLATGRKHSDVFLMHAFSILHAVKTTGIKTYVVLENMRIYLPPQASFQGLFSHNFLKKDMGTKKPASITSSSDYQFDVCTTVHSH